MGNLVDRGTSTMAHSVPETVRWPARYDVVALLGKGGGGEVWAARDRVTGRDVALKVLAEDAGEAEVMALVREAVTLSGLEGLGVPLVIGFGLLPNSTRRYLVRELVEGKSLEAVVESSEAAWLPPLVAAAEQLTVLHRAGLLHGDIKPANVIVGADGSGTLVDLGLATPWREGGGRVRGLTPKFAAPELFAGGALTVRAEVYALGATLVEALAQRGKELDETTFRALAAIAERATAENPDARYPSIDELKSELASAAKITAHAPVALAWPVVGVDAAAQNLAAEVSRLGPGAGLSLVGPPRSGRTTLLRRLAWTLGVTGAPVADVAPSPDAMTTSAEIVDLELARWTEKNLVIVVDDLAGMDDDAKARLRAAAKKGARIVAVGDVSSVANQLGTFVVPALDDASARDLVKRAVPSLPDRLVDHLLARSDNRPGSLRDFVKRLGTRAVTSREEIDEILDDSELRPARSHADELQRALDTGRFDVAAAALEAIGEGKTPEERVELAVARSRIALARGDAALAAEALDNVEKPRTREWHVARARTFMRAGDFKEAARLAALATKDEDAIAADALSVHGLALAYLGEDGTASLEKAVALSKKTANPRITAVALVSRAIAHQRAGRAADARTTYESALSYAEKARDAWTLATTRLNLGGLVKADGDLEQALVHLEGALDMGRRAGSHIVVQQALFNLANVDLYLGRYARAAASLEKLAELSLTPNARAQLLGLQAEYAARTGDVARAGRLYEQSAFAYSALDRPLDAAEAKLEGILVRLAAPNADVTALAREFDSIGATDFHEHEALAQIVRGSLAFARGDEAAARSALDEAHARATSAGHLDWAWRALEVRARLATAQGSSALARRDIDAALALLEETAAKLPRDLREVFWNDPRRRALRQPKPVTTSFTGAVRGVLDDTTRASRGASITSMGTPMPAEDRLQRIFEITRDLAREHDLDRLLSRVTEHAVSLLQAERGLVVVVNDAGEIVTHTNDEQSFSRSVAERVIREGDPIIVTSARDDDRLAHAVSVHQLAIQSIACVPIRGAPPAGKTIGALYLETRLRPGIRFKDELPTLAAFADQAAIAIESARLLDENRRRAADLERVNAELEVAKGKLAEKLDVRTEQLAGVRRDLKAARAELRGHFGYGGLVGTSSAMRKVYALIERIKDTDIPVLVTGESGTGKEVIAKAIHASGPRARQPFLGVNCGAIPANLLESELFGHVRGAFTGADRDRKGLFREAENGTLLLDEIGELPTKMQAGLLRVLQERMVRPVGGTNEEPCNARIVAATNRSLAQMVAEGTFREDLFYRLHVVELKIPALRERSEDVPALVDHFLGLFSARHKRERKTIERNAVRRLQAYDWPGNVRQLEHVLLNAWLLSEDDEIVSEDLDLPMRVESPRPAAAEGAQRARSEAEHKTTEKEKILEALQKADWNRVAAAKVLGIPRRTFYRRLKDYGIV